MASQVAEGLPTEGLRQEHRQIERVLMVMGRLVGRAERGQGFEAAALRKCVDFLRLYADACHHTNEEQILLPLLDRRGIRADHPAVAGIVREHVEGRKQVSAMRASLAAAARGDEAARRRFCEAARHYLALLRQHINKEDHVLFALADQALTARDQAEIQAQLQATYSRRFEGRTVASLSAVADDLANAWIGKQLRRRLGILPTATRATRSSGTRARRPRAAT